MTGKVKEALKLIVWMFEHRHSSTFGVFLFAMGAAWYLGDLGVTGMPPYWMLVVIAGGFTFVVFLLNEARKEVLDVI